jgi:hypothetical protein
MIGQQSRTFGQGNHAVVYMRTIGQVRATHRQDDTVSPSYPELHRITGQRRSSATGLRRKTVRGIRTFEEPAP